MLAVSGLPRRRHKQSLHPVPLVPADAIALALVRALRIPAVSLRTSRIIRHFGSGSSPYRVGVRG